MRSILGRARTAGADQGTLLEQARVLLRRTDSILLPTGERVAVDDSAIAAAIDGRTASIDAAIARLDVRLTLTTVGVARVNGAAADARLREILQQDGASAAPTDLFDAIGRALLRFVSQLQGPGPDLGLILPAVGVLGLAVILFVIATLGRALPERVRREVLVRGDSTEARADPAAHLRAADAALGAGRSREALHALFLYVITALAERELIRYDPALTDGELLVRAAAIPHADSLRDLVGLYERSWFGLREPSPEEAQRARDLALRVAP